ncbi:MAG: ABC transporter permease [Lachnospiraceae bacterium]|nr:ABC transporter permease [Lachnospiraceae bacterium]
MINQLKVEGFKLRRFILLYIVALILFAAGFFYSYCKLYLLPSMNTNEVFACLVSDTSLIFIISLVTSWFIGNDFSSRTIHNEIKIGYSRLSILLSRLIIVYIISVLLHSIYIFSAVLGFSLKSSFDNSIINTHNIFWFLTVAAQLFAIQSIITFITFSLKKASASISAAVCFTFITCNIIRTFTDSRIFTLSCFCLAQDSSYKNLVPTFINAIIVIAIAFIATYICFRKTEIK